MDQNHPDACEHRCEKHGEKPDCHPFHKRKNGCLDSVIDCYHHCDERTLPPRVTSPSTLRVRPSAWRVNAWDRVIGGPIVGGVRLCYFFL